MTVIDSNITDLVVDALDDLKAVDTKIVDVRGLSSVMDFLVIASGNSSRHIKSLADNVVVKAKAAGCPPIGVEGENAADWVLVDLGDVVVHVMQPAARSFYDLERLWSGEPEVSTQQDVVADHWA
ncbi:MAG: ribosome silencing factor [Alteromonadaceae bacterium]|nr:ribosome silencing factor [Alteromonadaceae bacterium]MBL6703154.1 ribosome silencing factor [Pseudomonadales bacterium]MBL6823163.1 ribosome silencing factor [Luminiphilus sp.]MDA0891586.1 ribosome silencing factor [Pseudomonadota bacterium]RCL46621.1 MAG: ribosome silencing factor [Halieaceae bacterium]RPH11985.1 MAG: ribosome silencing factor [Alteromonadaceae bacterium TMED101]